MDNWPEVQLGEVITLQRGFDLPADQRKPGHVPVVSSSGIFGTHFEAKVRGPGVVTGRYGTIGKVFYVVEDFWPLNTTLFVRDFKGNDPRFVSYLLQTIDFGSHNDKSSVPGVNRNHLHMSKVRIPPIALQRAIAHILGTLDDKIELNRRMNETLEAMARAIFKSWFVDFDPVRAKMEGRQPAGMDAETAALFPDSFEASELGEIPRGWRVGELGDIAREIRRGIDPNSIPPDTPYIGLEHMPRRSIALAEWGRADQVESNKFAFQRGDVLFGKLRPYFHKVGVAVVDGVCSTDIVVLNAQHPDWYGFVLATVSREHFVNYTAARADGTKMPRTKWSDMAEYRVVLPPTLIAGAFNNRILPIIERIRVNIAKSRTLARIRDMLLPKLVSGQIRVRDAEKLLETFV